MGDAGRCHVVYEGNLPKEIDKYGLRGIFRRFGKVKDVIIPWKRSRQGRYGFIYFWDEWAALESISRMDGRFVRGNKVQVQQARRRVQRVWSRKAKVKQVWVGKKTMQNGWKSEEPGRECSLTSSFEGEVNENMLGWLKRSLICISPQPRDLASMASAITHNYGPLSKVSAVSSTKFIITLPKEEDVEEALKNPMELEVWFSDIRKWSKYETCEDRRVWLDIHGIPPHGWNWMNFQKCVQQWGILLSLGQSTLSAEHFEHMRVQILTKVFSRIEGKVIMSLEDCSFIVYIKEAYTYMHPTITNAWNVNDSDDEEKQENSDKQSTNWDEQEMKDEVPVENVAQSNEQAAEQASEGEQARKTQETPETHAQACDKLRDGRMQGVEGELVIDVEVVESDSRLQDRRNKKVENGARGSFKENNKCNFEDMGLMNLELHSVSIEASENYATATQGEHQEVGQDKNSSEDSEEIQRKVERRMVELGKEIGVRFLEEQWSPRKGRNRERKSRRNNSKRMKAKSQDDDYSMEF